MILTSLIEKGPIKAEVYHKTEEAFNNIKLVLRKLESQLQQAMAVVDKRVVIKYTERSLFDLEFKISDDILIFSMHTDAFTFPESHPIWKTSYLNDQKLRSYCGLISIYNFLTDSIKYNRTNDVGVLIARIFVNSENHFFVEGKRQLGFLFNDFESDLLLEQRIRDLVENAIIYSLNYDILTPPYEQVRLISVQDLIDKNLSSVISTGKRLGFKLQSDSDIIK
ncbi:MAG: hypothetical protein IPP71_23595 [Bacteroidetes bacterium]|nr:hypothetical protein [Bacteroidota bacterium]